ncbi:polyubiquitin-like [Astyanax mexicanus]|uniref:polyubiquitin-like n=1 Tax=Astyanax mexicanus TaxID=7994 RepID=UPI0020CB1BEC|nr:polyubiquitin-like [Astyanax mexicanus]
MDLSVKLMTGECHSVRVSPGATVGELKHVVAQTLNETLSSIRLATNGLQRTILDNNSAFLSSFGLSHGSTVMLLVRKLFQVFVRNEKGQTKTYDVSEEETVDELKTKVYNKERTPIDQMRLVCGGKQLDSGTLKDYNIQSGSTIHMTLRLRGG